MTKLTSKAPHVARLFLGLVFFVFGLNGFLQFLPQPELAPEGGAFLGALAATGYMFPLIKGTEVVAGAMLLGNRLVPLALALLAPVIVNIVAFHAVLSPGLGVPLLILASALYLAYAYRSAFAPMLTVRAEPAPGAVAGEQRGVVHVNA